MSNQYNYNLQEIKENLTEEQIMELLIEFGAEPIKKNDNTIICKTICHNPRGEGSYKLYFYFNSKLCHCYTGCAEPSFDIFELTRKVMSREHPKNRKDSNWNLPEAINYIANKFGYTSNINFEEDKSLKEDLIYIENYDRIKNIEIDTQEVELKEYAEDILKHLPHPIILPWVKDGISVDIMNYFEICYNPKSAGIVIPHRDQNNKLIGIRERNLDPDYIKLYGKYHPARIGKQMFNHPLSFNLYGLYQNKKNIIRIKKVFVFESEKAVLQYATMFGQENNIAVAICGSSFINYQFWLLVKLGVQEIIIGLDKQFQELGDNEFKKLTHNLKGIHQKYGKYVTLSILWDKEQLLDYKDSPTDKGRDIFEELYRKRINLYG